MSVSTQLKMTYGEDFQKVHEAAKLLKTIGATNFPVMSNPLLKDDNFSATEADLYHYRELLYNFSIEMIERNYNDNESVNIAEMSYSQIADLTKKIADQSVKGAASSAGIYEDEDGQPYYGGNSSEMCGQF